MSADTTSTVQRRGEQLLAATRAAKERDHAERGPDSGLPIALVPWRGAEQVATVILGGERSNALAALRAVGAGFLPDCLAVAFEGWFVSDPLGAGAVNPDTGRQWDARVHDMSRYVERHGRDNGVVHEGLSVMVRNAAGDLAWLQQPFTVTAKRVHWQEPQTVVADDSANDGGAPQATGSFLAVLRHGLAAPGRTSPFRAMVAERYRVSTEAMEAATDAIAAASLEGAGVVGMVMLTAGDEQHERRRVIEEVTGRPWAASIDDAFRDEEQRRGRS